jgi:hexokinase
MNQNLDDFLKSNGLNADLYNFENEVLQFQESMVDGLNQKSGVLEMLPTYVGIPDEIQPDTKVLVIDLGGTNLRVGLIGFDNECNSEILEFRKQKMPGVDHAVSKDEVFDAIAQMTIDLVNQTEYVGFCFSNPFEIIENGDARVLHFGKELKVEGMVGCLIVENLKQAWARKGFGKPVSVTVLNDTVSTLLMGKLLYPNRRVSGHVGFILGTGMNISYVEANKNIGKISGLKKDLYQIINTECGDYALFARSEFDEIMDATTRNKGRYLLEKMVSGAFLGRLVATIIDEAVKEGLISQGIEGKVSTKHVNDFVLDKRDGSNPLFDNCETFPELRPLYFQIINAVLERAAKLVSIQLVAIIRKSGVCDNYDAPILLSIDGSCYAGEYFYRERIEAYLWKYLTWKSGICFEIVRPENASLLGASVAALGSQFS